jgi:hypothetical protein
MVERQHGKDLEQGQGTPEETNLAWQGEHPFFAQTGSGSDTGSKKPEDPKPEKLKTGDQLSITEGKQILTMPNGERLEVTTGFDFSAKMYSASGELLTSKYVATIASEPEVEVRHQQDGARLEIRPGSTKLMYPNDDTIVFDRGGICSITRGGVSVEFHKPHYDPLRPIVKPNRQEIV